MPKLRYVGPGYVVGVPARDLDDEEIATLGIDGSELIASGQYTDATREKPRQRQEVNNGPDGIS